MGEDDGKLLGVFADHFSSAVQPNPLPVPGFYAEIHRLYFCALHHCKYTRVNLFKISYLNKLSQHHLLGSYVKPVRNKLTSFVTCGKRHEIFWMDIFVQGDVIEFIGAVSYNVVCPLKKLKQYIS